MITRNNYEEFFLLYVDNELSPAERRAVESFVEENPDLKEEWELLLQCRVNMDETPVFANKELLFKKEDPSRVNADTSLINIDNYESWFLSYIDGELDEPSRQAVVEFAHRHPDKNIQLQLLQRTVNIPDTTITFTHKESLYRREEKRKVAWLPFARIAAAALVLGAAGLLIFHPFRTVPHSPQVAVNPSTPAPLTDSPSSKLADAGNSSLTPVQTPANENIIPAQPAVKKSLAVVTPRPADTLHLYAQRKTKDEIKDNKEQDMVKVDPPAPEKTIASVKVQRPESDLLGRTNPADRMAVLTPKTIDRTEKTPATTAVRGSFATQALLDHAVAYNDNGSPEEETPRKKNKLRGIFRKVTRALEKPSSREEDEDRKVLIGGFQFALK